MIASGAGQSDVVFSHHSTALSVGHHYCPTDHPSGDAWSVFRAPPLRARAAHGEQRNRRKFATVGVLYAVLLAFAIVVVWEKFTNAETTVAQDAGAAESVYRLSHGIDDPGGAKLRDALSRYLAVTVAIDWPAMDRGTIGSGNRPAREALDDVYATLLKTVTAQHINPPLVSEVMHQLDVIAQARRIGGHRTGHHLAHVVRRRCPHYRLYVLLQHAKLARANADDGAALHPDLFGAPGDCRHRPAVLRDR